MSMSWVCNFNVNDETRCLYRQSSEDPSCKTGVNESLNTTLMSFLLFQGSTPGLFNELYAGESRPTRLSPAERNDGGQVCPLHIPLDKLWASASSRSAWRPFGSEQFGLETCRRAHCRKARRGPTVTQKTHQSLPLSPSITGASPWVYKLEWCNCRSRNGILE
jgi:hypothetical protein